MTATRAVHSVVVGRDAHIAPRRPTKAERSRPFPTVRRGELCSPAPRRHCSPYGCRHCGLDPQSHLL